MNALNKLNTCPRPPDGTLPGHIARLPFLLAFTITARSTDAGKETTETPLPLCR